MDSIWEFRKAYNSAREVLREQDAFCKRAEAGAGESCETASLLAEPLIGLIAVDWSKESYPEDLQFEALVDVLRGRVKVNIHCYEAGMLLTCFDCSVADVRFC
jgi:hypothetical protein